MPALILFFLLNVCWSAHISTGFYKSLHDVQDKDGDELQNPLHPMIGIGDNWKISTDWGFSPQLKYIYNRQVSDDSYNDYSVHTFVLLYDFIWVPVDSMQSFALRFGLGTFIKRIKGEGGTVTIPNGTGTMSAYRPDETETSYSSTFNLGGDLMLDLFKDYFANTGLRLETFIFRPLSQEHRTYAYTLSMVGYF